MSWRREPFRDHHRRAIGGVGGSNSYVSYLNLVDVLVGGLDERIAAARGGDDVLSLLDAQPASRFTVGRSRGNCRSALRAYLAFTGRTDPPTAGPAGIAAVPARTPSLDDEVSSILRAAQALASRYYALTAKPLGVTGEVAEIEAAEKLGLRLADARSPGFDALRDDDWRVQIKGRAVDAGDRYRGRCPAIKGEGFDSVMLVLLDRATYRAIEIWEAPRAAVVARIEAPGGRARTERRSLAITQFKSVTERVWPPRGTA